MLFIYNFAYWIHVLTGQNIWIYFKNKIIIQWLNRDMEIRPKEWNTIFRIFFKYCVLNNGLLDFDKPKTIIFKFVPLKDIQDISQLISKAVSALWSSTATSYCLKAPCSLMTMNLMDLFTPSCITISLLFLFWVLIPSSFPMPFLYYSSFFLFSSPLHPSPPPSYLTSYILSMHNLFPNRSSHHKQFCTSLCKSKANF